MNPGIYTILCFFIKNLWIFSVSLISIVLQLTEEFHSNPFNPVFSCYWQWRFLNIPQTQGIWFYYRAFCFELTNLHTIIIQKTVGWIVVLTQKNVLSELIDINKIFRRYYSIIQSICWFITKNILFLLSARTDKLLPTPKVTTFTDLPTWEHPSNPIP